MPVVTSKKLVEISQAANPKLGLINALGDISGITVLRDQVLIAVYIRPEKTPGGVYRPVDNIKEDELQGKVGLIVKAGLEATEYGDDTPPSCGVGDWVVFTTNQGAAMTVNGVACRLVAYSLLRMKVSSPDMVF